MRVIGRNGQSPAPGKRRLALVAALAGLGATLLAGAPKAQAAEEKLAVLVGANVGDFAEEPLRYAESDARRMRDLLLSLGGVRPDRAILVSGGGPADVLRALGEAKGRAAELSAAGRRVLLILYYSGHGDENALHLAAGRLPLAELRRAVAAVPAHLRVSFIDACRTGTRDKGLARGPAFPLAATPAGPSGSIEIHASSEGELAQESDELAGSIFTHFLSSGLRGDADADHDGQVTLGELYSYAYRRTLMRTSAGTALQHPAMAAQLEGSGDVVLAEPGRAAAFLETPAGADRTLVFSQPTATVMGEASGGSGTRLALPTGRFLVVRRRGAWTGVAEVDLSWGGTKRLAESDFRAVSREELAARGGTIELRTWHLQPRVGFELAPGAAEEGAFRAGGLLGRHFGAMGLEADVGFLGGPVSTPGWSGSQTGLSLAAQVTGRIIHGRTTLSLLAGVELRWARGRLRRDDADRLQLVGLAPPEERWAGLAAGPRAGVRGGVALGGHFTATLEMTAAALFRRELDSLSQRSVAFHPTISVLVGVDRAF